MTDPEKNEALLKFAGDLRNLVKARDEAWERWKMLYWNAGLQVGLETPAAVNVSLFDESLEAPPVRTISRLTTEDVAAGNYVLDYEKPE